MRDASWDHPAVAVPSISGKLNSRTKYRACGGTTRILVTLGQEFDTGLFSGRKIRGKGYLSGGTRLSCASSSVGLNIIFRIRDNIYSCFPGYHEYASKTAKMVLLCVQRLVSDRMTRSLFRRGDETLQINIK